MPDYLNRMVNQLIKIPRNIVLKSLDIDENGRYWILSNGKVLSVVRDEAYYLTSFDNGKGYKQIRINGKNYYIHRLLALSFTPDKIKQQFKDYLEVHHLDRDIENNSLDNLCIISKAKHKRIHYAWNKLDSWREIPWEKMEEEQRLSQIKELYG